MKSKYEKDPKKWKRLYMLSNCFNNKEKQHLGLKWEGDWYCITHNKMNEKILIPKEELDMGNYSKKKEYLKRIYDSKPTRVNPTNMSISVKILSKYINTYNNE